MIVIRIANLSKDKGAKPEGPKVIIQWQPVTAADALFRRTSMDKRKLQKKRMFVRGWMYDDYDRRCNVPLRFFESMSNL